MDEHISGYDDQRPPVGEPGTGAVPPPPPPAPPLAWSQAPVPPGQPARKRWSSGAVVLAATLGAIIGALLASATVMLVAGISPVGGEDGAALPGTAREQVLIATATADVSQAVAAKVVPSVVAISTFRQLSNPFTGETRSERTGSGSGVFIGADGHIVTNNHVIEGASRITVMVGTEERPAKVVGTDPSTDLAVISIEGTGYPAIEFGSSADLKVGEYVMAVGSPFGLEKTVTSGIVSALNRSDVARQGSGATAYNNLIQTDAAINPGNSGGALVNAQGQLVGINTLIQSPSGASAGIGFAIPGDFARDIATQLIEKGEATHPYLGVSAASFDEYTAEQYGFAVSEGAYVQYVKPQSPASQAGVKAGDIIIRIGDKDVADADEMFSAIRSYRVGQEVEVEVVRGEDQRVLKATLGSDQAAE